MPGPPSSSSSRPEPRQPEGTLRPAIDVSATPRPDLAESVPSTLAPGAVPASPPQGPAAAPTAAAMPAAAGPAPQLVRFQEDYKLLTRLGRGQFGEVWRALAPGGVEVAVKLVFRALDDDASRKEHEALKLICNLHHPYLLATHTFVVQEDKLVIVMELAEDSLRDWLKKVQQAGQSGIPAEELIAYLAEAAEALDFLHSHHILHRDIKPENLLRLRGHAKVADFGLGRLMEERLGQATLCGTPLYMPPEVWQGQMSVHTDQYSLAMTYAELRSGKRIFSATDQFQMGWQHLRDTPDLDPLPEAEQQVLLRALAKDPEERFPSCGEFVRALRETINPAPHLSRPPSRWPLVAGSVLTIFLVVLTFVLAKRIVPVITPPPPAPPPQSPWLPAGFSASAGAQVDPRLSLYDHIQRTLPDAPPAEFVLLPRKKLDDPPAFYMQIDKVRNVQFATALKDGNFRESLDAFAKRAKWAIRRRWLEDPWQRRVSGEDPKMADLPVVQVTAAEAYCFARWLAGEQGNLPTVQQWYKAGGRFEGKPGPFREEWFEEKRLCLLPVGSRADDISVFGCRDMAGNGFEWTRDIEAPKRGTFPVRLHEEDLLNVLSFSFRKKRPFQFAEIPQLYKSYDAMDDLSFRVAIDVPVDASAP